jgi:metal-responsive CopG/Arc/MetJ family transcriptional regulator
MSKTKIAISIAEDTLQRVDLLIDQHIFPSRSRAIEEAIEEKLQRLERSRLARECAKLDPNFERSLAEEDFDAVLETWPEY